MVFKLFVSLVLVLPTVVQAKEVVWLELTPIMTYRDLTMSCKTDGYYGHYFGAEVDGEFASSAVIRAGGFEPFYRNVTLKADELKELRFEKDSFGRTWVTQFKLGARVLGWLLQNSGSSLDGCTPTQPLVTIGPGAFSFDFKIDSLGAGIRQIESSFGRFSGTRKDGRAYEASLYFRQTQYKGSSK